MKHCELKSFWLYVVALMVGVTLAGCSSDSDETGGDKANVNANSVDKSVYATRIEVPHLQPGNNYKLLVKTDEEIGVNYIIEWDRFKKAQRWTCFHWTKANSKKGWDRNKWRSGEKFNGYGGDYDPFQPDPDLAAGERSELSDYSGSGYNRGHICASEDRICSKNVNGQTFYLSNMQPQIYAHNVGVWSNMEGKLRSWRDNAVGNGGEMFVVKGGTIYDVTLNGQKRDGIITTIGANKIPVPRYFFMAILKKTAGGIYSAVAFWTEHKADDSSNLQAYMITIDELEARTGYDFFCNLADNVEDAVEASYSTTEWK